jgi:hypothetical protein
MGVGAPGRAAGVCTEDIAATPAKTTRARMEERSNAFMGKVLLFSFLLVVT